MIRQHCDISKWIFTYVTASTERVKFLCKKG